MKKIILSALSSLLLPVSASALTIVHLDLRYENVNSDIFIELYDEVTPNTVSNFLGYIGRGDFDDTFMHRVASYSDGTPFVIQGGGFVYVPVFDADGAYCSFLGGTTLVDAGEGPMGELGLRAEGDIYLVDADDNDDPDTVGVNDGVATQADIDNNVFQNTSIATCVEDGDIYRVNDAFTLVPVDAGPLPLLSEASLTNVRGTIAMALTGAGEDSGTNQWFVNMSDNTQLDTQNGGFTVFGSVLGSGMTTFDDIIARAVTNQFLQANVHPEVGATPLFNYTALTAVYDENLVKVDVGREVFDIDDTELDFGVINEGGNAQIVMTLTVSSQWVSAVDVDVVEDNDSLSAPFSLVSDCEAGPVAVSGTCTITVDFDPATTGVYNDTFDISFISPVIPPITIDVTGTAVRTLPLVELSDTTLNYEFVFPGFTKTKVVTMSNLGIQALNITSIALDNNTDYTFTDDCPASLMTHESCDLTIDFQPASTGIKLANISITTNAPESPANIILVGAGSGDVIPDIDTVSSLNVGDTFGGNTIAESFTVTNLGGTELTISSLGLAGADAAQFSFMSDCTVLQMNDTCTVDIDFTATSFGEKTATLTIVSDDPDETNLDIVLTATSSADLDNVPDAIEDAAPGGGDFNNNGVFDRTEDYVATLVAQNGQYVSVVLPVNLDVRNTEFIDIPDPMGLPAGSDIPFGALSFDIGNLNLGTGGFVAGLVLPAGVRIDSVLQYGSTPTNAAPHWYSFDYDAATGLGAVIYNDVEIENPNNGSKEVRSAVEIGYAEGVLGDGDLDVDSSMSVIIGLSLVTVAAPASDTGQLEPYYLLLISMAFLFRQRKRRSI